MLMLMKEEREGDMTQLFDHGIILSLLNDTDEQVFQPASECGIYIDDNIICFISCSRECSLCRVAAREKNYETVADRGDLCVTCQ